MIPTPLFLRILFFMATVPQELLDLLNEAQKQLEESNDAAVFHNFKEQELVEAMELEEEAKDFAFEQLQEANVAAGVAITELRKHFGV